VDLRDIAAGEESDGDIGSGYGFRKIRDGQNVVGIHREKDGLELAAERVDGGANGLESIFAIKQAAPSGARETDLVAEVRHGNSFWGKGKGLKGSASVRA